MADQFFAFAVIGHKVTLGLLIFLSIVSVAFIIERFIEFSKVVGKADSMTKSILTMLQSNSLKDIEELSRDKENVIGRALSIGLRHVKENGQRGLEEVFNAMSTSERPTLEKRLNFLATVGSNAPFIGLLGTVFGIMDAFRALATTQGEIQNVMTGISESLVATAVGLIVAIPAVIAFNYFQKRVKKVMQCLDSVRDLCVAYAKVTKP